MGGKYDDLIGGFEVVIDVKEVLNEEAAKKVDDKIKKQKAELEKPIEVNVKVNKAERQLKTLTKAAKRVKDDLQKALGAQHDSDVIVKHIETYTKLTGQVKKMAPLVGKNNATLKESNKILKESKQIIDQLIGSQNKLNKTRKAQSSTSTKKEAAVTKELVDTLQDVAITQDKTAKTTLKTQAQINESLDKELQKLKEIEAQQKKNNAAREAFQKKRSNYGEMVFGAGKVVYDTDLIKGASKELEEFNEMLATRNKYQEKYNKLCRMVENHYVSSYGVSQGVYKDLDGFVEANKAMKELDALFESGQKTTNKHINELFGSVTSTLRSELNAAKNMISAGNAVGDLVGQRLDKEEIDLNKEMQRLTDEREAQLTKINALRQQELDLIKKVGQEEAKANKVTSVKLFKKKEGNYTVPDTYTTKDGKFEVSKGQSGWDVYQRDNLGMFNLIATYKHLDDVRKDSTLLTREEIVVNEEAAKAVAEFQDAYNAIPDSVRRVDVVCKEYVGLLTQVKNGALGAADAIKQLNEFLDAKNYSSRSTGMSIANGDISTHPDVAQQLRDDYYAADKAVQSLREQLALATQEQLQLEKHAKLYGYALEMSAKQAGRAQQILSKNNRAQYVVNMLQQGYSTLQTTDGKYGFDRSDLGKNVYTQITKTEYEFAQYLSAKIQELNVGWNDGLKILASQNGQLDMARQKVSQLETQLAQAITTSEKAYERMSYASHGIFGDDNIKSDKARLAQTESQITANNKLTSSYKGLVEAVEEFVEAHAKTRAITYGQDDYWEARKPFAIIEDEKRNKLVDFVPQRTQAHYDAYASMSYLLNRRESAKKKAVPAADILKQIEQYIKKANTEIAQSKLKEIDELVGRLQATYGDEYNHIFGAVFKKYGKVEDVMAKKSHYYYDALIAKEQEYLDSVRKRVEVQEDITSTKHSIWDQQDALYSEYDRIDGELKDIIKSYEHVIDLVKQWQRLSANVGNISGANSREIRSNLLSQLSSIPDDLARMIGSDFYTNIQNKFKGIKTVDIIGKIQSITNRDIMGSVSDTLFELENIDLSNLDVEFIDGLRHFALSDIFANAVDLLDQIYLKKQQQLDINKKLTESQWELFDAMGRETVQNNAKITQPSAIPSRIETAQSQAEKDVVQSALEVVDAKQQQLVVASDVTKQIEEQIAAEKQLATITSASLQPQTRMGVTTSTDLGAQQTSSAIEAATEAIEAEGVAAEVASKKKDRFADANKRVANSGRETKSGLNEASDAMREEGKSAKQYADEIINALNRMNSLSTKINDLKGKNKNGVFTNQINSMQQEKSALFDTINSVASEVNSKFNLGFGEDIVSNNSLHVIAEFFKQAGQSADISSQDVNKFVDSMRAAERIVAELNNKYQESFNKISALREAISGFHDGSANATTDSAKDNGGQDYYNNTFNKYIESLEEYDAIRAKLNGVSPINWSVEESSQMDAAIAKVKQYGTVIKKIQDVESAYFANKQQYVSGSTTMSSLAEDAEKAANKTNDVQNRLKNAANKFAQESGASGAIVTKFVQSANGISKIDFSVLDSGTNTLRKFSMETGRANQNIHVTETTVDSFVTKTQSALKQIESTLGLLDKLSLSGVDISANSSSPQVQNLLQLIQALQKAVDAGDTNMIAKLTQQLKMASGDAEKLHKQLLSVDAAVKNGSAKNLGMGNLNGDIYGQLTNRVQQLASETGASAVQFGRFDSATNTLSASLIGANGTVQNLKVQMNGLNGQMTAQQISTGKLTSSWDTLKASLSKIGKQFMTAVIGANVFYKAIAQVRKGVGYVKEIDLALTELKKVTDETAESYDRFLNTAASTASKIGSTISDFTEATANFARLGYTMEESAKMAESAVIYKNVADGIDTVEAATDSIISTMKAFGIESSNTMQIVDIFNEVGKYIAQTA